jgi:hypothetical protein
MTNPINSTDRTYMWQSQPYVTWKGNDYNQASLVNARPETNGSWILSKQGSGKDGNAFLPRPIKHWRKQLASNTIRGGTENVTISEIDRPGLYNMLNNNSCCDISKNSSSIVSDIQVKNNSTIYDNSESVVTYADVSNCWNGPVGKRICCNPEANLIKYKTSPVEKNYISYSYYLQSRCLDYNQNISTTKVQGNAYFNSNGIATYPTNLPKGCQVLQKKDCANDCCNCNCGTNSKIQNTIYKPNNRQFAKQGATSSKSRINALRENTIDKGGALFNNAYGLQQINNGICSINGDSVYYVKTKPTPCIQTKCGPAYVPPPPPIPCQFYWANVSGTQFTVYGLAVTYGNNIWVAVGQGGNSILYSDDNALTWKTTTVGSIIFSEYGLRVLYANNRWVAVGASSGSFNTILYSDDGKLWNTTTGTKFNGLGADISYGKDITNNDKWIAVGRDSAGTISPNTIIYSTNGINWNGGGTPLTIGRAVNYGKISNNNGWVAVGRTSGSSIVYSNNGINWINGTGTTFLANGYGIKYANNMWVAVGEDDTSGGGNTILYSMDGTNWNSTTGVKFTVRGLRVNYGNGRWVALGQGGNTILTSDNGIYWTTVSGSQFITRGDYVEYGDGCWVAVGQGGNTILTSANGVVWTVPPGINFDTRGFYVQYENNRWVSVGQGINTILYSDQL